MLTRSSASRPVRSAAEAIDRARGLCSKAQIVLAEVASQRTDLERRRSERRTWRMVWEACCANPDHILACCSYCARVRGPNGGWGAIPSELSQALHRGKCQLVQLSHGICPDCLARHHAGD